FCQKRTGSVFAVSSYFSQEQRVQISGETKVYNGLEVDGVASTASDTPDYNFCSTCGSPVYWTVKRWSGTRVLGIALGNSVDPGLPPPTREYYVKLRHRWVPTVPSANQFEAFPEVQDRHQAF